MFKRDILILCLQFTWTYFSTHCYHNFISVIPCNLVCGLHLHFDLEGGGGGDGKNGAKVVFLVDPLNLKIL